MTIFGMALFGTTLCGLRSQVIMFRRIAEHAGDIDALAHPVERRPDQALGAADAGNDVARAAAELADQHRAALGIAVCFGVRSSCRVSRQDSEH